MSTATPDQAPRGLYAIGSAGLGLEALVLLLAAPAVLSLERGHVSGLRVGYLFAMAVLLILAAARLRKRGGKAFATALQVLVIAGGVITWPMYVVGVAFGAIWIYWLRLWPRHAHSAH
ncbi:MAG TPA: DUF4233 domain-containing protein [Mycobacteriales bacterium]|jgi:hypothetical protein|nr:DUF4233 domain-containing protein [Mycobacteriales bacterium]